MNSTSHNHTNKLSNKSDNTYHKQESPTADKPHKPAPSSKHSNRDRLRNSTNSTTAGADDTSSTATASDDAQVDSQKIIDTASEEQLKLKIIDLQHQLDAKQKSIEQLSADHLRSRADMDNYKKRLSKERADAVEYANQSLISSIIEVLDNFDRALNANAESQSITDFKNGISLIYQQLQHILQKDWNVVEIDALDKEFDPMFHEAVGFEEDKRSKVMTVSDVLQKGYSFKGRVIRHARVKVKKPVE